MNSVIIIAIALPCPSINSEPCYDNVKEIACRSIAIVGGQLPVPCLAAEDEGPADPEP